MLITARDHTYDMSNAAKELQGPSLAVFSTTANKPKLVGINPYDNKW